MRLTFLDGIRGVAAIYVLVVHLTQQALFAATNSDTNPNLLRFLQIIYPLFLAYGHYAVVVFIVLSGFVLMLPVSANPGYLLSGGIVGFAKRRSRRILPPYYAALLISLAILAIVPRTEIEKTFSANPYPAFDFGIIASHLFLAHNFSSAWDLRIDPPMWTVAIEWQIYFVFALLLLPICRRFGVASMVVAGIILGLILPVVFHSEQSCTWFLGLFCLGAAAAEIVTRASKATTSRQAGVSAWRYAWIAFGLIVVVCQFATRARWQHSPFAQALQWGGLPRSDFLVGLAVVCFIIDMARSCHSGQRSLLVMILESKAILAISRHSYSLYLTHMPVMLLLVVAMNRMNLSSDIKILFTFVIGIPLSIMLSYAFASAFEFPFHHKKKRTPDVSPAVGKQAVC